MMKSKRKGILGLSYLIPVLLDVNKFNSLIVVPVTRHKKGMTEFVHYGARHEESIDRFRIDILCPQPARCITEENNHDKTDC